VVAVRLLDVRVVRVDDLLAHQRHRLGVGDKARAQTGVDREPERLQRREQQLRLPGGKRHRLRQRPERQERLVGGPPLRRGDQVGLGDPAAGAAGLPDRTVEQPEQIQLERHVAPLVALVVEDERLRLEGRIARGLAEPAAERAAHQPLELRGRRRLNVEVVRNPAVDHLLHRRQGLQLSAADAAWVPNRSAETGQLAQPGNSPCERLDGLLDWRRLGRREPHRQVDLRTPRLARRQGLLVAIEIARPLDAMGVPGVADRLRAGAIVVDGPAARDAQQREVRLERVGARRKQAEQLLLVRGSAAVIGDRVETKQRPGVL
jgi:hypothetical protein